MPVLMTVEALECFLAAEFPHAYHPASGLVVEAVWDGGCRVRQRFREDSLRPGGTISGPTMMALADFTMYVALLGAIGPVPLAVTTNLNTAEARLLKLGKRLAVGEIVIHANGDPAPLAHATSTYSLPNM